MDYIPSMLTIYEGRADIDAIKIYYDHAKAAIEYKYDPNNPMYNVEFLGMSAASVREKKRNDLKELSIEGGMALLSAAEAAFRVDFITRCRSRKKEQINSDFKTILKKYKKLYEVRIKEDILDRWQKEFPLQKHYISTLKNRFDYRNWIAHGRYWSVYSNAGEGTFSFDSLYIELSSLMTVMGPNLLKPVSVGAMP